MQIKINRIEATANLIMQDDLSRFRESMRDFRAFQKKEDVRGSNYAIKRAHEAAKAVLAKGSKLPATYAHEISLYNLGTKAFKVPFTEPKAKPAKLDPTFLAALKAEFDAAGFKIKKTLLKAKAPTEFTVAGIYTKLFSDPMIKINEDKSIEVFKYVGSAKGTDRAPRKKKVLGKAKNKTERKVLLAKLVRIRDREAKASRGPGDPTASGKLWFVVDTTTLPATALRGPFATKADAQSFVGVHPGKGVKRMPADSLKRAVVAHEPVAKGPVKLKAAPSESDAVSLTLKKVAAEAGVSVSRVNLVQSSPTTSVLSFAIGVTHTVVTFTRVGRGSRAQYTVTSAESRYGNSPYDKLPRMRGVEGTLVGILLPVVKAAAKYRTKFKD